MLVIGAGAVLAGEPHCGFDSSWALVWGGGLLHGRLPASPHGLVLPTAHPAALLLGALVRLGPASASRTVWSVGTELAVLGLLAAILVLCRRIVGPVAAWAAVLVVSTMPALRDAVREGTLDVAFAALCLWAVSLAGRRPGVALALAGVAALARPEAWLVVLLLCAARWRAAGVPYKCAAVAILAVTPLVWLVMGATLFGDAMAAVHVTVSNAAAAPGEVGVSAAGHSAVAAAGPAALVAALLTLFRAWTRAPLGRELALFLSAALVMGLAVVVMAVMGAGIPERYFLAEWTLLVAAGVCVAGSCTVGSWSRGAAPIRVGPVLLAASLVAAGVAARPSSARSAATAAQNDVVGSLGRVLAADHGCSFVAVAPVSMLPLVVLAAGRPVTIAPVGLRSGCRLSARDPQTAAGAGWGPPQQSSVLEHVPPSARILSSSAHWVLYVP